MTTFFIVLAVLGGTLMVLQLLMGMVGAAHDLHVPGFGDADHGDAAPGDAVNLLSFRALTAGVLFFGLVGLVVQESPLPILALPAAALIGFAVAYGVAYVMRAMGRMESDGVDRLEHAVGQSGTVYLGIPGARAGAGKVHITLSGRLVECRAQAEQPLATGTSVLVIDIVGPDLVEVIPSPQIGV